MNQKHIPHIFDDAIEIIVEQHNGGNIANDYSSLIEGNIKAENG